MTEDWLIRSADADPEPVPVPVPVPVAVPVPVPVPVPGQAAQRSEGESAQSTQQEDAEITPVTVPEAEVSQGQPEPEPAAGDEDPVPREEFGVPTEPEAGAEPAPEAASEPAGPRCPYCRESLEDVAEVHADEERAAERPVACVECDTPVHARCAQIHGRCVTRGCSGRSFAFVDRLPRPQIRATRIVRPRAPRRRPREGSARPREPRQVPECPRDWWRRDAPLLVVGLVGILSLALFGDSLAEGARRFDAVHASLVKAPPGTK